MFHFTNNTIILSNMLLNDMLWQVLMFYLLTKLCFYFKSIFISIMQLLLWIFPQYLRGSLSYEIQVGYLTCNGKLNRNWNIQLFTEYKLPLLWCVCCCLQSEDKLAILHRQFRPRPGRRFQPCELPCPPNAWPSTKLTHSLWLTLNI